MSVPFAAVRDGGNGDFVLLGWRAEAGDAGAVCFLFDGRDRAPNGLSRTLSAFGEGFETCAARAFRPLDLVTIDNANGARPEVIPAEVVSVLE